MRRVQITRATDYDLLGDVIENEPRRKPTELTAPSHALIHHASDGRRVSLRVV
jgi:hypothetical protein